MVKMGGGNSLIIDSSAKLTNCRIRFAGTEGKVYISKCCRLSNLTILLEGKGSVVHIGEGVCVNATPTSPTRMNAIEGCHIDIGCHSLFSNGVELHTSDYHSILQADSKVRINRADDIIIGDHVWIGLRTLVLKGTQICTNSVIGAGSIVNTRFNISNVLIAGVPAKVIKEHINWDSQKI